MNEEMKMILALIRYLDLEIRATGGAHTSKLVDATLFTRDHTEYTYVVSAKS